MLTPTVQKHLIEFQKKKEVYIPIDINGQIIHKVNKIGKWTLRAFSSTLGLLETYQLSTGLYFEGLNGIEFLDLLGLATATVPIILYPTLLFKPKKAWPFRFISFEEEEFVFNLKRKTTRIRYDQIQRFQISTHGINSSIIELYLKDGSMIKAPWFSTNANEKQLEIRLAINDELNRRIGLSYHSS